MIEFSFQQNLTRSFNFREIALTTDQNLSLLLNDRRHPHGASPPPSSDQARTQAMVSMFMSKPSYFKDVADLDHDSKHSADYNDTQLFLIGCSCVPRKSHSLVRKSLYSLFLTREVSVTEKHLPSCKYANNAQSTTHEKITIQHNGITNALQFAISLSLSINRGAGAFSISPSLWVIPIVDRSTSPVFKVHSLTRRMHYARSEFNLTEWVEMFQIGFNGIVRVYHLGRASPADVDPEGFSAMHIAMDMIVCRLCKERVYNTTDLLYHLYQDKLMWSSKWNAGPVERMQLEDQHCSIIQQCIAKLIFSGVPATKGTFHGS